MSMTPEKLEELEKLEAAATHANAALIYSAPQNLADLVAEVERLRSLLRRACFSLQEGFSGGEWSALIPEEINYAAAREHDEALELLAEIRVAVGWDKPKKETP
jgi:hypothetical protein